MSVACQACEDTGFRAAEDQQHFNLTYSFVKRCSCAGAAVDALAVAGVPPFLRSLHELGLTPTQQEALARTRRAFEDGTSVILVGRSGVGKTGLAVVVARDRANDGTAFHWCHVPTWLRQIRESYRDDAMPSELALIEEMVKPEFAVFDDLGAEPTSDFTNSMLYAVIDGRDAAGRRTLYTSNLSPSTVESTYGERVSSRLGRCQWVNVGGTDRRRR